MYAETLYKTDSPQNSNPPAEYYELGLETVRGYGRTEYRVIEKHGWWDEDKKRPVHSIDTLNPALGEGYATFDEARNHLSAQKRHRARGGFIHSFRIEIPTGLEIHEVLSAD